MEFRQTAFTDTDTPVPYADSLPITINITDDTIFEGLEYFQARIVNTSDLIRVRIGQRDTVNVTIIHDSSEFFISLSPACRLSVGGSSLVNKQTCIFMTMNVTHILPYLTYLHGSE